MLKILITKFSLKKRIKNSWIKQIVKETLKQEEVLDGEVSIVLGDDALLQRLNKEYRGVDKPTDVLAFEWSQTLNVECSSAFHIQGLTPPLGEIIISLDAVTRQAKEYNHSFEEELAILLIHGGLHILGYDHSEEYLPSEPMAVRAEEIFRRQRIRR